MQPAQEIYFGLLRFRDFEIAFGATFFTNLKISKSINQKWLYSYF